MSVMQLSKRHVRMKWILLKLLSIRYPGVLKKSPSWLQSRDGFCTYMNDVFGTLQSYRSPPWSVMFFGTDDFSLRSLEVLHREHRSGGLVKKLDVVSVVRKKSIPAVQRYCRHEGLTVIDWPVTVPKNVYDIGIVVSFGHLIPSSVINAFPLGIINVHGSLLPRWRGAAPIIHALLNNDDHTGITIMRIAPHRFDVGHVVSKVAVPVCWDTKSKELTAQLAVLGAQELLRVLPHLAQLLREASPQSLEGVTKAPKVSEKIARVKWSEWSCSDIQAHFRALDDYVPLWSLWQGTPIKLRAMEMHESWSKKSECRDTERNTDINSDVVQATTRVHVGDSGNRQINTVPGNVIYDKERKQIRVCCKDGWVVFHHVLLKGRKPMTAQDFYNGFMSKITKDLHRFT